jgi:hypothetical protein
MGLWRKLRKRPAPNVAVDSKEPTPNSQSIAKQNTNNNAHRIISTEATSQEAEPQSTLEGDITQKPTENDDKIDPKTLADSVLLVSSRLASLGGTTFNHRYLPERSIFVGKSPLVPLVTNYETSPPSAKSKHDVIAWVNRQAEGAKYFGGDTERSQGPSTPLSYREPRDERARLTEHMVPWPPRQGNSRLRMAQVRVSRELPKSSTANFTQS